MAGVKGHIGVIQGQVEVNLPRNAPQPPNLIGKIPCRAAKPIHCAQNVKTVRLCTEFDKIIKKYFSDMPHIVAFPRRPSLTLRVPHGSKIETCSDFSENNVKLFVLS